MRQVSLRGCCGKKKKAMPNTCWPTVPYLTVAEMVEVDQAMVGTYHISLAQMMENAGRHLAHLARERFLGGDAAGKRVLVLTGSGGNGGGALVAARRLAIWGAEISIVLGQSKEHLSQAARDQLETLSQMDVEPAVGLAGLQGQSPHLILDGIAGYGLAGSLRSNVAGLVRWANSSEAPVLSLDVPTGVNADDGKAFVPAIIADATMTLALPKSGLRSGSAVSNVGELYLADIGVPSKLYEELFDLPDVGRIFSENEIIRIW